MILCTMAAASSIPGPLSNKYITMKYEIRRVECDKSRLTLTHEARHRLGRRDGGCVPNVLAVPEAAVAPTAGLLPYLRMLRQCEA